MAGAGAFTWIAWAPVSALEGKDLEPREENYNIALADLLARLGLKAVGEVKFRGRYPDILLEVNGILVVVEGKKPGARQALVRQARERIEEGHASIVVMVEYASVPLPGKLDYTQADIRNALLNARYNVAVLTLPEVTRSRGQAPPTPHFIEGVGFQDLVGLLLAAYEQVVSTDVLGEVVKEIEAALEKFARSIGASDAVVERIRESLELGKGDGGVGDEEQE